MTKTPPPSGVEGVAMWVTLTPKIKLINSLIFAEVGDD